MTKTVKFIDLFCGIGGFRLAIEEAARINNIHPECVFSSDIDANCAIAYEANFGDRPHGDITEIESASIPDHDVLLAGFPCQPFSIIGTQQGFRDKIRGTLFFEIARILADKQPTAFVLENVKMLVGHDRGRTMATILSTVRELGYSAGYCVLNALDFGLPQKRERVFIVGLRGPWAFTWPEGGIPMKPLAEILEPDSDVPDEVWASEYIRQKRAAAHTSEYFPSIWHENKAGNISSYPYSCALRANASYNYLLVNGQRRLTSREMLRLQGFPDSYKIVVPHSAVRSQAGNSLPVPVAKEVLVRVLQWLERTNSLSKPNWGHEESDKRVPATSAQA